MASDFPWPITDEELLLNNALDAVMSSYEPGGDHEEALVQKAAASLIVEAYNQGVRDKETLANYALRSLQLGRP